MFDIIGSIVIYKTPTEQLAKVMGSFLNTELNVKLYLVDNSPDDRARAFCQDPRMAYIFNGRNLGFGAGHNIALRKAGNEAVYHLVLNPDVYFDSGVLEKLFEFACSRPDIGLLMPKVLNPDGSMQYLCKRLPTPFDLILRRFLPGVLKPLVERRLEAYELRDQDYTKLLSVAYLSGCFMLMRCEALSQVGFFDERYFMYFEDLDLCRRIHARFKTAYYPDVAIYHQYGKASYREVQMLVYHIQAAVRYFHKWGWFTDRERSEINRTRPCRIE
jgi:GT2 family glycosyltransferase